MIFYNDFLSLNTTSCGCDSQCFDTPGGDGCTNCDD